MELWAIIPELILGSLVLVLLPLGAFLSERHKAWATGLALAGLGAAGVASWVMLDWGTTPVFQGTYAVDPFAVYFKLFAVVATALTLLATVGRFKGRSQEGEVPALLILTCLGMVGLAASQNLALIVLFIQLVSVSSYTLTAVAKSSQLAAEGALKLFLFTAASGAALIYGMSLLYGLTGSLMLPEVAARLPASSRLVVLVALGLVLFGYGFKVTLVPFHGWAPDTYQGAPTPVAGFLAVGPKAAGLAVLLRTFQVGLPEELGVWPEWLAVLAAVTMTVGNLFALLQKSVKRLLAYSSIGQAGYLLVGVAAAAWHPLGVPAVLVYLAAYLFMELGAFLAVDAVERRIGSDDMDRMAGLGRRLPVPSLVLALSLLSLAGFPPLGGFFGKVLLFSAALGVGWTWLAAVMALNVTLSLAYFARVFERLYLRRGSTSRLESEPRLLRLSLGVLAAGSVWVGAFPQPWMALAEHSARLLRTTRQTVPHAESDAVRRSGEAHEPTPCEALPSGSPSCP